MKPERDRDNLIRELDELARNVHNPLERRLMDTALWFHKNKDRMPRDDLAKRVDFLEKTLDIVIELFAMNVQRLHSAEGRGKSAKLWVPNGMRVQGDLRRLG